MKVHINPEQREIVVTSLATFTGGREACPSAAKGPAMKLLSERVKFAPPLNGSFNEVFEVEVDDNETSLICQALAACKSFALKFDSEEVLVLLSMFTLLPLDEADNPGNVHGFCY